MYIFSKPRKQYFFYIDAGLKRMGHNSALPINFKKTQHFSIDQIINYIIKIHGKFPSIILHDQFNQETVYKLIK